MSADHTAAANRAPLVSVVIPTYNRARTLRRAALSVLNQTMTDLELIIVDDASRDDSVAVAEALGDPRVRVLRHERNAGAGAARNTGMAAARGVYIAFQDSDDEWLLDKLEHQVDALRDTDDTVVGGYCAKIVYGIDREQIHGGRRASVVPDYGEAVTGGDIHGVLQVRNLISTQTLIVKRAAAARTTGFDTRLKNSVDWDFVLRLSALGSIQFVDAPLCVAYRQDDSISLPSRKSAFSQLIIVNKMRRRGASAPVLATHYAGLGTRLTYYGKLRAGRRLIRAALARRPLWPRGWLRLGLSYTPELTRTLSSWRKGYALAADRDKTTGAKR